MVCQTGVITGTNMAIDLMNREKGGRGGVIVNIASTAGKFVCVCVHMPLRERENTLFHIHALYYI